MHRLSCTDTQHDAQNLRILNALSQLRVEAPAMDLNKREMEPCGKCDRFDQVRVCRISISSRNCRMLPYIQSRDRLREICATEIRVRVVSPVQAPKTGVYCELGEVRKPLLLGGAGCHTALQRAEMRAKKAIA